MKDTKPQIQETQKTPNKINTKKSTIRYLIYTLQKIKDKEKILTYSQEKKANKP